MITNPSKQPHLVFISPYCALDQKSGAAQSIRTILQAMTLVGWKASSFTGSCQDTPNGFPASITTHLKEKASLIANDQAVDHHIFRFSNHQRSLITASEENRFYHLFCQFLDKEHPTHVITFGGLLSERMLTSEAQERSIQSIFYLANPNYQKAKNFFERFNFVVTDSLATANLYKDKIPNIQAIGKFINPEKIISKNEISKKEFVTFINPSPEKGVEVVLKIIDAMTQDNDINFLIVESRGTWRKAIERYQIDPQKINSRVRVVPFQENMSRIYERTKILLTPSLWHESGPRVAAEAIMNDIPVIGFRSGGIPEMIGDTGYLLDKPEVSSANQYRLPNEYDINPWVEQIRAWMRDSSQYNQQKLLIQAQKDKFNLIQRAEHLKQLLTQTS
jgi:glycosyltransferase involved in cell wall biosynthesis